MNIFILDETPSKCAKYHCDKHVLKMLLESAQILCTVSWLYGKQAPYKPTHINHPCVLWIMQATGNWHWLVRLSKALNQEYKFRFMHNINHKSYDVIQQLALPPLKIHKRTSFIQVMPAEYKIANDPVLAYRNFYMGAKSHLGRWTKRSRPHWFI